MSLVVYDGPTVTPPGDARRWWAAVLLDVAHRTGAVALLAGVAVLVLIGRGSAIKWPLAITAGAADLGMCAAWGARHLAADPAARRRTAGVLVFCLAVFALSLHTMLLDHFGLIGTDGLDILALSVAVIVAVAVLVLLASGSAFGPPPAALTGRRRANAPLLACLILFVLALHTLLLDRLRPIGLDVADFFTPTPVSADHR